MILKHSLLRAGFDFCQCHLWCCYECPSMVLREPASRQLADVASHCALSWGGFRVRKECVCGWSFLLPDLPCLFGLALKKTSSSPKSVQVLWHRIDACDSCALLLQIAHMRLQELGNFFHKKVLAFKLLSVFVCRASGAMKFVYLSF